MTDHSDLIRRLVISMVRERSREPGDAWHQAEQALSSQSLSLSEAREEIERLKKDRDEARDQAQALLLDAVAELKRANELAEIVEMFRSRIKQRGEWDDGCFYHNGTSASELQEPLRRAQSVLENGPAVLADATNDPASPSLSSLRKGAEDRIQKLEEALRLTAGALQAGRRSMAPVIAFTGEWSHLGVRRISDILDQADAALVSGSREDGASLLRTIETLPDHFTDDGNCCAGKLKEPRP